MFSYRCINNLFWNTQGKDEENWGLCKDIITAWGVKQEESVVVARRNQWHHIVSE